MFMVNQRILNLVYIIRFCLILYYIIITASFIYLLYCYILTDLAISNVCENSHKDQLLFYKICGLWGNHEGSMLLWCFILSSYSFSFCLYTCVYSLNSCHNPNNYFSKWFFGGSEWQPCQRNQGLHGLHRLHDPAISKVDVITNELNGSMLYYYNNIRNSVLLLNNAKEILFNLYSLFFMLFLNILFILFVIFTSNPFLILSWMPLDGKELNPILQDPGLAIHPPLIYIGYLGFSMSFIFIISYYLVSLNKKFEFEFLKSGQFIEFNAKFTNKTGIFKEKSFQKFVCHQGAKAASVRLILAQGQSQAVGIPGTEAALAELSYDRYKYKIRGPYLRWFEILSFIKIYTLISWSFLTFGIAWGSWWAYYELGWGGWWFWDPVENASLMPWLISTAFIHSLLKAKIALRSCNNFSFFYDHCSKLVVPVDRSFNYLFNLNFFHIKFDKLTAYLGIFSFLLAVCGTFLVRSGILTSVHSFANDSTRGVFLFIFFVLMLFYSLYVIIKFQKKCYIK
jgi:cytochrome c biogenesis factor